LPFAVYRWRTDEKPRDTLGEAEGSERLGRSSTNFADEVCNATDSGLCPGPGNGSQC